MTMIAALTAAPWACAPAHVEPIVASIVGIDQVRRSGAVPADDAALPAPAYQLADASAVIPVRGPILRGYGWLRAWGVEVADPDEIAALIQQADADPAVREIVLSIDSPGGTIGGVETAATALATASKPTRARVDGLAASAAYWIASQADRIDATEATAEIGSIGVYTVLVDASERAAALGLRVHLVSSGGVKGAGAGGSPIRADAIAATQALIDDLAAQFRAAVAAGRPSLTPDQVAAIADGRLWTAPRAAALGLIDSHKDTAMDLPALQALAANKPQHAAQILSLAAAGRSLDEIVDQLAADERAAAQAAQQAELDQLRQQLAAAQAQLAERDQQLAAAQADLATAQASLDRRRAVAPTHADPGEDAEGAQQTLARADYATADRETKLAVAHGLIRLID